MKRNNYMRPSSEDNLKTDGFSMPWGFYLFIGIYWWMIFGGLAEKLIENSHYGLDGIMSVIFVIAGFPAVVFTIILITETLDFFGFTKKESVNTEAEKTPNNPVYEYTQQITKATKPQSTYDSAQKSSFFTSAPQDKIPASVPTEKFLPPENFFSVPRKVDWDELNKTQKYHGDLGETFVYDLEVNYLTKIGRPDLAEKVHHVANEGDGHGYDIKSFYENGGEKFIEVKSTNASSGSTFNISKNEFNFLQAHLNNAVVYHVHNVNNERETTLVIYPASEVVNSPDISPSGYVVKM